MHKLLETRKGRGKYAQLVWSLFLSLSSAEGLGNGLRGRGHRITSPRGFLRWQGGGNSAATAIPTTTTCSRPLNAAHYHLAYLGCVYWLLLFKKLSLVRFFLQKGELTKTKKNTRTLCNWALRIKCTSIFLYVFFYRENFGLQKLKIRTVCWHYMCT